MGLGEQPLKPTPFSSHTGTHAGSGDGIISTTTQGTTAHPPPPRVLQLHHTVTNDDTVLIDDDDDEYIDEEDMPIEKIKITFSPKCDNERSDGDDVDVCDDEFGESLLIDDEECDEYISANSNNSHNSHTSQVSDIRSFSHDISSLTVSHSSTTSANTHGSDASSISTSTTVMPTAHVIEKSNPAALKMTGMDNISVANEPEGGVDSLSPSSDLPTPNYTDAQISYILSVYASRAKQQEEQEWEEKRKHSRSESNSSPLLPAFPSETKEKDEKVEKVLEKPSVERTPGKSLVGGTKAFALLGIPEDSLTHPTDIINEGIISISNPTLIPRDRSLEAQEEPIGSSHGSILPAQAPVDFDSKSSPVLPSISAEDESTRSSTSMNSTSFIPPPSPSNSGRAYQDRVDEQLRCMQQSQLLCMPSKDEHQFLAKWARMNSIHPQNTTSHGGNTTILSRESSANVANNNTVSNHETGNLSSLSSTRPMSNSGSSSSSFSSTSSSTSTSASASASSAPSSSFSSFSTPQKSSSLSSSTPGKGGKRQAQPSHAIASFSASNIGIGGIPRSTSKNGCSNTGNNSGSDRLSSNTIPNANGTSSRSHSPAPGSLSDSGQHTSDLSSSFSFSFTYPGESASISTGGKDVVKAANLATSASTSTSVYGLPPELDAASVPRIRFKDSEAFSKRESIEIFSRLDFTAFSAGDCSAALAFLPSRKLLRMEDLAPETRLLTTFQRRLVLFDDALVVVENRERDRESKTVPLVVKQCILLKYVKLDVAVGSTPKHPHVFSIISPLVVFRASTLSAFSKSDLVRSIACAVRAALLFSGADPSSDSTDINRIAMGTIHAAIVANDFATVESLLKASPELASSKDPLGYPALFVAAERGNSSITNLLLEHGAYVLDRGPGPTRMSSLHIAAQHGHLSIVKMLLFHGAEVDVPDSIGRTPISLALDCSAPFSTDCVAALVAHGADPNQRTVEGLTYLIVQARADRHAMVNVLLENGASTAMVCPQGWTALHHAAAANALHTTRVLLQQGTFPNARDPSGNTPLHLTSNVNVAAALVASGARKGLLNIFGRDATKHFRKALEPSWLDEVLGKAGLMREKAGVAEIAPEDVADLLPPIQRRLAKRAVGSIALASTTTDLGETESTDLTILSSSSSSSSSSTTTSLSSPTAKAISTAMAQARAVAGVPVSSAVGSSSSCMLCLESFTPLRRKHVCRRCATPVCAYCSSKSYVILSDSTIAMKPSLESVSAGSTLSFIPTTGSASYRRSSMSMSAVMESEHESKASAKEEIITTLQNSNSASISTISASGPSAEAPVKVKNRCCDSCFNSLRTFLDKKQEMEIARTRRVMLAKEHNKLHGTLESEIELRTERLKAISMGLACAAGGLHSVSSREASSVFFQSATAGAVSTISASNTPDTPITPQ